MDNSTNKITNRQLFFILFLTISTYSTIELPKIMAESAGRNSWIPIIAASVIFGIAAIIITKLNNMYQGKVLFDYSQDIVGKFLTYSICLFYLLYFLIVMVYLKIKMVGLLKNNFLPLTPQIVMLMFSTVLFGYVAHKGITNVARMFEIIGVCFIVVTVILCIFMATEGITENVLPLFDLSETKNILPSMKGLMIPYGGIEILLVIPFTKINKKSSKVAFFSLLFIGLIYVLIVESTIKMLGINNTIALNDSFIEAVKAVELPVIERTDIFYLTFGLTSLFAGMIIIFTAVLEFLCKIFPNVKRHILTIVISILIFFLSLFALNLKYIDNFYDSFVPYLILISGILIPSLLLIIANIKKRLNKNKLSQGE